VSFHASIIKLNSMIGDSPTFLIVFECIDGRGMSNALGLVVGLQSQRSTCISFRLGSK
jgi:hypothetical protein